MKVDKTINSVLKDSLCTGCGTCVGICPRDAVEMVIDNSKGIYVPQLDMERCNECGICLGVCPGHAVDFKQLNSEIFGKQPEDILLGNYINCYIGHATDYDIRYNSASGGLVTALLAFALDEGLIDGALVTKMKEDRPLEPQPFIARTREEIISASKSKYCPVPANIALKEILKEEGKFAVVGLPCHIHGIRKAELVNKKLRERIVLHLGLLCLHPMNFSGTEFVLRKYGVKQEGIAQLDYRGEGWPGSMTIHLKNGTRKLISHDEHMIFLGLGFFIPWRCTLCCDQINDFADISLGDAWLPEVMEQDKIGTSVVISRSRIGENLLEQAIAKGEIALESIEGSKVRRMGAKKSDYEARSHVAHLMGKKQPDYRAELPKAKFITYLRSLRFYFHMSLSRRYLQGLIAPLIRVEGLASKLISLRGLRRLYRRL